MNLALLWPWSTAARQARQTQRDAETAEAAALMKRQEVAWVAAERCLGNAGYTIVARTRDLWHRPAFYARLESQVWLVHFYSDGQFIESIEGQSPTVAVRVTKESAAVVSDF